MIGDVVTVAIASRWVLLAMALLTVVALAGCTLDERRRGSTR